MHIKHSRTLAALALSVIALSGTWGCAPSDPSTPTITGDQVPRARVVAIGNSLTAGFTNEALFMQGQLSGYANLVTMQITGSPMSMPLIASPGIASTRAMDGSPRGQLYVTASGQLAFRPIPGGVAGIPALLLAAALPTPYDNLGVPGAYATDLLNATSSANSIRPGNAFFDFILRNSALPPGGTTQLSQLEAMGRRAEPLPSTLLFWIGGNDVLLGATTGDPVLGEPDRSDPKRVTTVQSYSSSIDAIVARLAALEIPQVALLTLPDVPAIPYFTQIAAALQAGGGSPALINADEDNVALILLPAQFLLFQPDGSLNPAYLPGGASSLPSTLTLTQAEVAALSSTVAGYNAKLAAVAAAQGWALVDVAASFAALPMDPAAPLNRLFPLLPGLGPGGGLGQNPGSVFGLDGVHPSQRGYAFVAGLVIDALNAHYDQDYPSIEASQVQNTLGFEEFGGSTAKAMTLAPGVEAPFAFGTRSFVGGE